MQMTSTVAGILTSTRYPSLDGIEPQTDNTDMLHRNGRIIMDAIAPRGLSRTPCCMNEVSLPLIRVTARLASLRWKGCLLSRFATRLASLRWEGCHLSRGTPRKARQAGCHLSRFAMVLWTARLR